MDVEVEVEVELEQLYESVKPIVWLLSMEGFVEGKKRVNRQTAFAVKDGILMTSAHGSWRQWSDVVIKARPLLYRTTYDAERLLCQLDCDLALYKVRGVVDMPIGKFGSGALAVGEKLMCVGHPEDLVGSAMFGQVMYPCVAFPTFSFTDSLTCALFNVNTWRNTPNYMLMGHIWNVDTIKLAEEDEDDKRDLEFFRQLKCRLPIIQTSGMVSGSGASGAPMFNMKGEIVGMQLMSVDGYDIGSHVRVLAGFLEEAADYLSRPSPSPSPSGGSMEVGETSSESRSRRGKKRKNLCTSHCFSWIIDHVSSWCCGRNH